MLLYNLNIKLKIINNAIYASSNITKSVDVFVAFPFLSLLLRVLYVLYFILYFIIICTFSCFRIGGLEIERAVGDEVNERGILLSFHV